jgi:hypothetical protein
VIRAIDRRRWVGTALPGAALLALLALRGAGAAPVDPRGWEECRGRLREAAAHRQRLTAAADSLASARRAAALAGDAPREARLLARGEALADSLRDAALAGLAQEFLCAETRRALLGEIDAALPSANGAETDTLRALRERVAAGLEAPVRAEFEVAPPQEADPPEILRLKAGYALDLVDRADRWLDRLTRERKRLVGERLRAEAGGLVADQWFFDERAALRVDTPRPATAGGAPARGALEDLLRADAGGPRGALAQIDAMEGWLRARRGELTTLADTLERRAERREREP